MMPPEKPESPSSGGIIAGFDGGSALGKRYRDAATGLEMLCTKAGAGTLGVAGRPLAMVEAKQLPSSD